MSIDTDAEKYCMLTFGTPFLAPIPIATGTLGEDEQAAFLGMFWEGLETGEGSGAADDDTQVMPTREGLLDNSWFGLVRGGRE